MPFGEPPVEEEIRLLFKGIKSATLSVGASDTQDTSGCDYICDGTCDEVEINQAIAALPTGGGLIHLLEGTYNVCGPIVIDKDNIAILGAGANTVIRVRDNHNANINVIEATGRTNLLIKDLRIDGNTANQTAGVMHGIVFNAVTYSKIEACWVEDLRNNGIYLFSSSNYNILTGNTCNGNDYGINLWFGCDNNTIADNTCQGNNYGIYLYLNSNDNTITGNTCQGNNFYGIWLDDGSNNNTVAGNTCEGNDSGINADDCDNNTITGNTCCNNLAEGIYARDSDHNTITGNTLNINAHDGIGTITCSNNTIAGNTFRGNGDSGIWLSNSSNNNTVEANTVTNNGLNADITHDGIFLADSDYNDIQGNTVRTTVAAPPPNRQRYGINISNAACDGNLVKDNDLHQSGQTAYFNDAGTDTRLPELWVNSIFDDSDVNVTLSNVGRHVALSLADNQDTHVRFNFRVPSDFHQLVRARIVVAPAEDGDLYWEVDTNWGLCGESYFAGTDVIALHAEAVGIDILECLDINAALDGITAGDHVGVNFRRNATDPLDTIDEAVFILQFWLQYV